jgi:ABC-type Na+ efflux pump permease subunit
MIKPLILASVMFLGGGFAPSTFAAGTVANVQVVSIRVDTDGRGIITFSAALGGTPPSCVVSAYTSSVAIDTNTAGGKSALATALTAKAEGSSVWVYGLGSCSVYGNYVEDMAYISMQ